MGYEMGSPGWLGIQLRFCSASISAGELRLRQRTSSCSGVSLGTSGKRSA